MDAEMIINLQKTSLKAYMLLAFTAHKQKSKANLTSTTDEKKIRYSIFYCTKRHANEYNLCIRSIKKTKGSGERPIKQSGVTNGTNSQVRTQFGRTTGTRRRQFNDTRTSNANRFSKNYTSQNIQ